jgi:hypothetical protein
MAITDITITQDNVINGSNLLPIHSPLAFIADVTYSGTTPDVLYVQIRDDTDTLIDTWKAIPYKDLLATVRQFVFIANDPVKTLMEDFCDTFQLDATFEHIEEITKILKIRFVDPDTPATYDEVEITFVHGASQFGSNPNLDEIFNNAEDTYFAAKDGIIYIYYYNDNTANTVDVSEVQIVENDAVDYDDNDFTDFDDSDFTILTN